MISLHSTMMPIAGNDSANPTVDFTLARKGTGLRDLANNDPLVGVGGLLGVMVRKNLALDTDALAELIKVNPYSDESIS